MRKLTFKTSILSLAALCGLTLTLGSCANEDIAQNGNGTDNDKNLTIFSTGEEPATRTSMESNGTFYWEAGDKIWVMDDNGVWRQSSNSPSGKTASFKFKVPGKFTKGSTYKVYYSGQFGYQNHVIISANQTQTEPNSTVHFGRSGDCGTADAAWSNSKNGFTFTLDHQAAYLIFQPYTGNSILHDCFLTKIEVNSDDDITNTYTLNPSTGTLTGTGYGKKITLTTQGSGSYVNGFPLTNTSASITTNGAYLVIAPGTHTISVRYWLKDIATGVEGCFTESLPQFNYQANKYYNISTNFMKRTPIYYQWDAVQPYWYGHEWDKVGYTAGVDQPIVYMEYGTAWYSNASSQYNHVTGPSEGSQNPLFTPTSANHVPNANEMSWYCLRGDMYWDNDEAWIAMGHLHKGGIWIKKMEYIKIDAASEITAAGGDVKAKGIVGSGIYDDFRVNDHYITGPVSNGIPVNNISKYFYLPAMGAYYSGQLLYDLGQIGLYWTSTAGPTYFGAYYLYFVNGNVQLKSNSRAFGASVQVFK